MIATTIVANAMEDRVATQVLRAATTLASGEFPLTEDLLKRTAELLNLGIILIGQDRHVAFATMADVKVADELLRLPGAGMKYDDATPFVTTTRDNVPVMIAHRALTAQRDSRYMSLAVVASLADVKETANSTALWMGVAAFMGMLIVATVGHFLARGITVPLRALSDMADKIGRGDRTIRVVPQRTDEVGTLAQALNGMAETLTKYEQTVAENSRLTAMGEMAARMAHEIRNPLTAIKLHVQLLLENAGTGQRASLTTVLNEIKRLELVVSSTVNMSRQAQLVKSHCSLNLAVIECMDLVNGQFQHCGIVIETALASDLPAAWLDADKVKQVLLNILNNAAEELPSGGRIHVSTYSDMVGNRVALQIDDSGPGLGSDKKNSLFAAHLSKKPSGLGIGLRLCKELVELHGGGIEAGIGNLGGARFVVWFPLGAG